MNTIFISGKVSGESYLAAYNKFAHMQKRLLAEGWVVYNPMLLCNPSWSWIRCMVVCFYHIIFKCDSVLFLSDWQDSRGSKLERKAAVFFKKIIKEENHGTDKA
ncbi:MAG: DUF4406 domain-containing protein [Lentimicrobiaceae bacterium]|nr:DUF4406 domain-containing protein [Lentimicrobiaceae bacterium]